MFVALVSTVLLRAQLAQRNLTLSLLTLCVTARVQHLLTRETSPDLVTLLRLYLYLKLLYSLQGYTGYWFPDDAPCEGSSTSCRRPSRTWPRPTGRGWTRGCRRASLGIRIFIRATSQSKDPNASVSSLT